MILIWCYYLDPELIDDYAKWFINYFTMPGSIRLNNLIIGQKPIKMFSLRFSFSEPSCYEPRFMVGNQFLLNMCKYLWNIFFNWAPNTKRLKTTTLQTSLTPSIFYLICYESFANVLRALSQKVSNY